MESFRHIHVVIFVFIFLLFSDLLIATSPRRYIKEANQIKISEFFRLPIYEYQGRGLSLTLMISFLVSAIFLSAIKFDRNVGSLAFTVPFACAVAFFEHFLRSNPPKSRVLFSLLFFLITIFIYAVHFWSGYGRIVIGTYAIVPMFIAHQYLYIKIRPVFVAISAPFFLMIAFLSRHGSGSTSPSIGAGSASDHLFRTAQLWSDPSCISSSGFDAWLGQASLLFFSWVPRFLWSSKPLGVGYISVDQWLGREGYGKGFSISLGFIGEQIYLLCDQYWIGIICSFALIVICRFFVRNFSIGYAGPLVCLDVSLVSYFWGGQATFGSRVWFFVVPCIIATFLISRFRRRTRISASHPVEINRK
ncbi:hypothetical protein [Thioclava sp. F42-5]|uniref:hypothetical protein n=1 Tax=Thioclava sp. F42-5 TaxID=1973005 RepID=UPI00143D8C74|nr:hypothetical protein [Thioclava sp. F42-5]